MGSQEAVEGHLGELEQTWQRESGQQLVRDLPSFLTPLTGDRPSDDS